jgi:hypothetical protein
MTSDLRPARVSRGIAGTALLLFGLTSACNVHGLEGPELPTELPGHILIVSGMGRTDTTANVKLDFPFVVQLGGSSSGSVAGHTVKFTSLVGNMFAGRPFLLLGTYGSTYGTGNFTSEAGDVADAQGRARVQVHLAAFDSTANVEVAVPDLGMADTVSFTIVPDPR